MSVFMFQTVSWAACHRPSVCGSSTPLVLGNRVGVGRPRHAVQLVGDVVVLVPDDQVGIAALAGVVAAAVGVRPVLVIAFDDGVGGDRHRGDVAFAGIVVDDDVDLRRAVAVDDVERNAVQRAVAVGGTVRAPVGVEMDRAPIWAMMAAELAATGALLMFWFQGLSEGKSCWPSSVGHDAIFQFLQEQVRRTGPVAADAPPAAGQRPDSVGRWGFQPMERSPLQEHGGTSRVVSHRNAASPGGHREPPHDRAACSAKIQAGV